MPNHINSDQAKPQTFVAESAAVARLRAQGLCPTCHDLEHHDLYDRSGLVYSTDQIEVALAGSPRMLGHTIIIWKQHHDDFTSLAPQDTAALFVECTRVANALKRVLGAEKVYLVTMCDGSPNHLHVQLLPRHPGDPIGSTRLVAPRATLQDGPALAARIREALDG